MQKRVNKKSIHGGDIYRNHVDIDFSVNVNPLGMPERVKAALHGAVELCGRYPDREAETLKKAAGEFLAVPEDYLLFGSGASELFMAAVHGIRPHRTVIPIPSFYGYEYAAKAVESEIVYYETDRNNGFCLNEDIGSVLTEDTDLLFLANPNNPTGNLLGKEFLADLLRYCRERKIYVLLDECFIEFCGSRHSMLPEIEAFDNLMLVRAFTKIFSIPGVRLGYMVCKNQRVLRKIAGQLPEWNLSCFAQEAGRICMKERAYIRKTEHYIRKERQFLQESLKQKGFLVYPSAADFILFYSREPLYEKLLERGILIRDCSNFRGLEKGFYRIAVKSREENEMLLEHL